MFLCFVRGKDGFGFVFFFQAEDGIRDADVTGVQTCALPTSSPERENELMGAYDRSECRLVKEIDLCQIDDFVAAPTENRFEHEEAEAGHLLKTDRRRHGEFLPGYENFDQ